MYPHSFLWHFLWLAPRALQLLIAAIMIRRGLVRQFPIFFLYTVFQMILEGTLFALDHSAAVSDYQYWYAYWAGLTVSSALRFGIIWEVCTSVFRNYPGLRPLQRFVFRWAVVVLLLLAIAVAASAPEDGSFHFLSRTWVLDLSVNVMQSGLWLLLVALSAYFRLSWRSFAYGIAFGLGIFATVALAAGATRLWTGFVAGHVFDFVIMAAYNCSAIVWLVYVLIPERRRRPLKDLPENNLEQWNAELQRLLLQ
jgi:hypothetical protein